MKKIITLLIILAIGQCSFGANATLDKIEQSLYGFTYATENESSRVDRIEKKVYGKTSSGALQSRISKLKSDLSADQIGQEISPREDSFMTDDDFIVYEKEPAEAASIDYPVINELEKQVFQKEFKSQNIKTRLSNLEKKTFNKTYDSEDLSTRVDRLKAELKPQSFMANGMEQQDNDFYLDQAQKLTQDYHLNQYGSPFDYNSYNSFNSSSNRRMTYEYDDDEENFRPAKPLNLSAIEKKLYRTKFENQSTSERLTRIETSVFGTSFPSDSDSERMARISSAIQAQKSAKRYDSDKWNRNVATAVQIGTLILMVLACIL